MPRVADGQRGVGHVAEVRDLAVGLGRRRDELVAETRVDGDVRAHPDVVLREEPPQRLPIVANGIDQARHREIDVARQSLEERLQIRERDDAALLAGGVLIELDVLALEPELGRVRAARHEHGVANLEVVQAVVARKAEIARYLGGHTGDGEVPEFLAGEPRHRRRDVDEADVVGERDRAIDAAFDRVEQRRREQMLLLHGDVLVA